MSAQAPIWSQVYTRKEVPSLGLTKNHPVPRTARRRARAATNPLGKKSSARAASFFARFCIQKWTTAQARVPRKLSTGGFRGDFRDAFVVACVVGSPTFLLPQSAGWARGIGFCSKRCRDFNFNICFRCRTARQSEIVIHRLVSDARALHADAEGGLHGVGCRRHPTLWRPRCSSLSA